MADQTRTIEIVVETKDAVKDIDKLNESLEETTESTEEATKETKKYDKQLEDTSKVTGAFTNQLDKMTGGMFSTAKGILTTIKGLKSLKVALIATGLGAILVVIGSLVAAFSKLQGPMNVVEDLLGGIGSVVNNIIGRLGLLGTAIIKVFEGDWTGAAEAAKASVDNLNESLTESFRLGQEIAQLNREVSLDEARVGLAIANRAREIERLTLISRQLTATQQEKVDALNQAFQLEKQNIADTIELNEKKALLAQKTFEDSFKNDEDIIALFNAQEAATRAITSEQAKLRELENRRVEANNKTLSLQKSQTQEIKKQATILEDAIEPSLDDLNKEYDRLLNKQGEFGTQAEKAAKDIVLTYDEAGKAANDAEEDQTSLNQALGVTSQAAQGVLDIFSGKTTGKDIFKFFLTTLGSILSLTSGGATTGIFSVIGGLFADGGLLRGPSHDQGGIWVNAEGGEGIINKRSMSVPWIRDLASELNQIGGGVKFADGGIVPTPTGQEAQLREIQSTLQQQQIVLYKEDVDTVNNLVNNVEFRASL